jgi:NAD-dependent histone deacetylase SIR2
VKRQPMNSKLRPRVGYLRPDVVLYNEPHPEADVIGEIMDHDLRQKPDMLIVMGTTLSIKDLRKYVQRFSTMVHQQGGLAVWINKDDEVWRTAKADWQKIFDCFVLGDVDDWSERVAIHWRAKKSGDWNGDGVVDPEVLSRYELVEQVDIASLGGSTLNG